MKKQNNLAKEIPIKVRNTYYLYINIPIMKNNYRNKYYATDKSHNSK